MRVGHYILAKGVFTLLYCPHLCEAQEELLVARETVLNGSGLAREGGAVRIVGSGNAAEVGDVLIKCLLTIHGKIGKRFVVSLLAADPGGGGVERRKAVGFPPLRQ